MATLSERIISGKGLLLVDKDTDNFKKAKVVTLFTEVIRKPQNEYLNFAYNPPRSRYATLTFLRDDHVIREEAIEYPMQTFDFLPDISAQTLYAVECSYAGILESFANLGTALGLTVTSVTNHIEDWVHLDLFFDTIKVICYSSTAIKLTLVSTPYDLCPEQSDKQPPPPPPPPPPTPPVPPNEALSHGDNPDVSEPYDGGDDGGDTVPFPGDELPPPGEDTGDTLTGQVYLLTYQVRQFPGGSLLTRASVPVLGQVGGIRFKPDGSKTVQVFAQGALFNPNSPPSPGTLQWRDLQDEDDRAVDLNLVGISPYP